MVAEVKLLVLKVDPELHKTFKKMCAASDETMTSVFVGCMKKYIADHKKVEIH